MSEKVKTIDGFPVAEDITVAEQQFEPEEKRA